MAEAEVVWTNGDAKVSVVRESKATWVHLSGSFDGDCGWLEPDEARTLAGALLDAAVRAGGFPT